MSRDEPSKIQYMTSGGISVTRSIHEIPVPGALDKVMAALDDHRGALFTSSYEYPGRYTRWAFGFANPPVMLTSVGRDFIFEALNARGQILLQIIAPQLTKQQFISSLQVTPTHISGTVHTPVGTFTEEERSRQPSVFSVIRAVMQLLASSSDIHLGLYGAFGYDLVFQFEDISLSQDRAPDQRDLVLYLPDELIVIDHRLEQAMHIEYDFAIDRIHTEGLPHDSTATAPFQRSTETIRSGSDHQPGQYAEQVHRAKQSFARGDLFEVVPGQTLFEPCSERPSNLFSVLQEANPSPYGFLINLGEREFLIGASPEMYVRVEGGRVETCPISGTIPRGGTPLEDAENIRELLNSVKDESELTMCTDVDRNDKSRICVPGSVQVIGRRQIEMYSRVIHTVDHIEGRLRDGYDALDAFLTHMWAVTVTGAPKRAAISYLEQHELSPRRWYGGAVGFIGFNGSLNTGLTLRTIRLKHETAEVRVGATLLFDSDPDSEEQETRHKAAAMLDVVRGRSATPATQEAGAPLPTQSVRILLVDHQDSFVHTLANYFRQTGATVITRRSGFPVSVYDEVRPHLVVLSPGPGIPDDFHLRDTIAACEQRNIPIFGVCLGLQGIVEYFGGSLGTLQYPMHGKASQVTTYGTDRGMFRSLPTTFRVARYHSLFADVTHLPSELMVTAASEDGVIMAVQHATKPIYGVQFHPESILTLQDDHGLQIIRNVVASLVL